jgi:TatD DNase family protein
MIELFDSHTHLEHERFDGDRDEVIARAKNAGVTRMVSCGSDLASSRQETVLASRYPGVYAAVGIHGHEARSVTDMGEGDAGDWLLVDDAFGDLVDLARLPGVVALGEIGLDYHYDFSPRDVQQTVMQRQLALAAELDLPVILHNREADDDTCRILDAAPGSLRGVLHCFMADEAMARWAVERDLYVGIAGPITFGNVEHLDEIVPLIPLHRLLIETDSPYLAPHPRRGKRNEPAFVRHVAERVAEIVDMPLDELARVTTENACRLFGIE